MLQRCSHIRVTVADKAMEAMDMAVRDAQGVSNKDDPLTSFSFAVRSMRNKSKINQIHPSSKSVF